MDMLKMMKQAAEMKSKLGKMEESLKNKIIDVESNGIKIKINAKSEILDLKLPADLLKYDTGKVEKTILSAIQEATKKAHGAMMEEAKSLTGGMKIPGLM